MTESQPLSDQAFMGIVETMLSDGGEWRVSMSKAGIFITYQGRTHAITSKHADVMFECIPRKCAGATKDKP